MNPNEMNVTNMLWQPPMLRLTQIAELNHDSDQPTPCFVCPQHILMINRLARVSGTLPKEGESFETKKTWGKTFECTQVLIGASVALFVMESPETIALMRDRALGHNPTLKPA